jgi:ketosteroid isomerase-like protein
MISRTAVALGAAMVAAGLSAQDALPTSLVAMADTEREFARTAQVKGVRDSFLDFFADDSIAFAPSPTSARARLLQQPSRPFSEAELRWEPRIGDVAASGEIGWLTGPSTFIDQTTKEKTPRYGNYLSIWRKQPDGRWRVFIDVGTSVPSEAPFAPGFTRMPFEARYQGNDGKDASTRSLTEADRRLNERIGAVGASRAYAEVVTNAARLHRPQTLAATTPHAIAAWLEEHAGSMSGSTGAAEASAAGDLGYSYGTYSVGSPPTQSGAYVRIWTRHASGRWLLTADITQPAAPAK